MVQGLVRNVQNKLFLPKIYTTNNSSIKVHKIFERDKNKMPYYNVLSFIYLFIYWHKKSRKGFTKKEEANYDDNIQSTLVK
jgi:hypothetical protein